jgi:hypothetical protein
MTDDTDLRRKFESLRRESGRRTPDFDQVLQRSRPPDTSGRFALGVVAGVVVVVAAVAIVRVGDRPTRPSQSDRSAFILAWKAPTDFLLQTPGEELLRTIPRIGEMPTNGVASGKPWPPATIPAKSLREKST